MRLALIALLGCRGAEAPVSPPPPQVEDPCVTWRGGAVSLSPPGAEPRHHPTLARVPGGTLLVAWQIGKSPATVAVRAFDDALAPLGDEVVHSGSDSRATHPQVVWGVDAGGLAWTREEDGAARWRPLGVDARPTGEATVLASDRPSLYPDAVLGEGGAGAVIWLGHGTPPVFEVARLPPGSGRHPLPRIEDSSAGGPPTVAVDPAGRTWLAWPELRVDDPGGESRLRAALLGPEGPAEPVDLLRSPEHFQRLALGFPGDGLVAGWTRYPTRTSGWGAYVGVADAPGQPLREVRRLDTGGGRMLHLDALGAHVVAAWEEPGPDGDRDLRLQVLDPQLSPRCEPTRVHPPSAVEETRAQVQLWQGDSAVEGVVLWQSGPHAREQRVWGRRFTVRPPG